MSLIKPKLSGSSIFFSGGYKGEFVLGYIYIFFWFFLFIWFFKLLEAVHIPWFLALFPLQSQPHLQTCLWHGPLTPPPPFTYKGPCDYRRLPEQSRVVSLSQGQLTINLTFAAIPPPHLVNNILTGSGDLNVAVAAVLFTIVSHWIIIRIQWGDTSKGPKVIFGT